MDSIKILDCTLRDGGYCNQWAFGRENILKTTEGLVCAGIDVIECGFITRKASGDPNISKFPSVQSISDIIPADRGSSKFVAMINFGEFEENEVPQRDESMINGLRVAFHKKNMDAALDLCRDIKSKGYDVYVQAMVTMAYSDTEFLNLISRVNKIRPYAFYIVDSFGMMKRKDIIRYFSLIEHNLDRTIFIGFHSHNNLQLAYSNAIALLDMRSGRDLIIDSSVYGMGRGAGNLNTELFINHLNEEYDAGYDIAPILTIMDEVINGFYQKTPWGYSLPNYLSAVHSAHPNYAGYLSEKNTLTVEAMDAIFAYMTPEKRVEFDKAYIESLYLECMDAGKIREQHFGEFTELVKGKTVLLIAPGRSSEDEKDTICAYSDRDDVISIGINIVYAGCDTDYTFVSNIRRYREIPVSGRSKCITTSNIPDNDSYLQIRYRDLLNEDEIVRDNAGLMAVKFFIQCGAGKIVLAGFDGYSYDSLENYADGLKAFIAKKATIDATNDGMSRILSDYSRQVDIEFLTKPKHYRI